MTDRTLAYHRHPQVPPPVLCRHCGLRIFWSATALLWFRLGATPATKCQANDNGPHEPEEN